MSLASGGILVNYGSMSGKPVQTSPSDLIFKDIQVRGFWRTQWYKEASFEVIIFLHGLRVSFPDCVCPDILPTKLTTDAQTRLKVLLKQPTVSFE